MRYYDPSSGRVLYGDEDIRSFTPESWRQRIAIVPQDPALFSNTIAENSERARCFRLASSRVLTLPFHRSRLRTTNGYSCRD